VTRRRFLLLAAVPLAAAFLLWPESPPALTGAWMRALGLEPRFETVAGVRLRYVRTGAGSPVVLIHGIASSIYTWKDVLPALSRDHDVVAVDLPGFGASDQPPDLTWAMLPAAVSGLMDRLGIPRASLVGHSLGGAVAVTLALDRKDRVERLVLVDSAGFNLAPRDRPFVVRLAGSPAGRALERLPYRRLLVRLGLRQVFHDDRLVTPERIEEYLAPMARPGTLASLRSLTASQGQGFAATFAGRIGDAAVPTLIVWGREDRWIPLEQGRRFEAAIRGSRLVVIDGCGHMPQEERPGDLLQVVEPFLSAG
jgi:pimeloyl-ACP methyl ester carboxylesterase